MGLCKGLQAGATARLTKGLQGYYGVAASSPPTYPTTDLIQAEIYPDNYTFSGSNVMGVTAAVGVNLSPTGTVTQVANGINFGASSALTHSTITIPTSTPFTLVYSAYMAATGDVVIGASNTRVSGKPYIGFAGTAFYILGDTNNVNSSTPVSVPTGKYYMYVRRNTLGFMYYGGTGIADTNLNAFFDYNLEPFSFNCFPRTLYDTYNATSANMSRFLYYGTNGDLVTSGAMPDLVSYLVSKNGVAT